MYQKLTLVLGLLSAVAACGCADALLGLSADLSAMADGLEAAGNCLSPLEPTGLHGVFALAVPAVWEADAAVFSDELQPGVSAYYAEYLGEDILPRWYLNERLFRLDSIPLGSVLRVELLRDAVDWIWLYDAEYTQIAAWETHDFAGGRRVLEIPIVRDSPAFFLRLNLAYLSETGDPVVRLTRMMGADAPLRSEQTVVLSFSGRSGVTLRSGNIVPTDVASLDDPVVRDAIVESFRESFAPFRLTVLTDADSTPAEAFSVIYIGHTDPPLGSNGQAEQVDGWNRVPDDIAIVDIGSEALSLASLFGRQTWGAAIGKVAAHEMGHLLGLCHVSAPDALMTTGCRGAGLDVERLVGRTFTRSPLSWSDNNQWVLGFQDSVLYLSDILGLAGDLADVDDDLSSAEAVGSATSIRE